MRNVKIKGFRFLMQLGIPDAWLPWGEVWGHPGFPDGECIFTSSPVDFDEKSLIMKTASGRSYEIESFDSDDKDKWVAELKEEVAKNKAKLAKKYAI